MNEQLKSNSLHPIRRVLVSVSNKEGLKELCEFFVSLNCEIVATTSTLKTIQSYGLPCTSIDSITQFPEILGGRVKTLHPKIFGGILAREALESDVADMQEFGIKPFDAVVCNLYPFEQVLARTGEDAATLPELIENIDIGGVSLLRAAAKNHAAVAILSEVTDYKNFIGNVIENKGSTTLLLRQELAVKAFQKTAAYDRIIAHTLESKCQGAKLFPEKIDLSLVKVQSLRYGENPHQKAAFYKLNHCKEQLFRCLHGKELSYNNMLDMEHALRVAAEMKEQKAAVILKHNTPCGVGVSEHSLTEAYSRAFESDPVSPFGGIVCVTDKVTEDLALKLSETFLEMVLAPSFDNKALEVLQKKKNLRLVTYPLPTLSSISKIMFTDVRGGFLAQEKDDIVFDFEKVTYPTILKPAQELWPALKLGMTVVKHTRSNAIVLANSWQTLAIAGGFTNRKDAVEQCLRKVSLPLENAIFASDAFFPFPDSIELIKNSGVKVIIQPGGSVQDEEVIKACDRYGISMIFTGFRHFKH